MKTITPYLLWFALTITALTLIFRFFLSYGIENDSIAAIAVSAAIYGFLMFGTGWYFGHKDEEYLPIYDIGFRFHFTTYIIHSAITLLWIKFGFCSKNEDTDITFNVLIYWGMLVLIHFVFFLCTRKNSIKNLDKDDLFE